MDSNKKAVCIEGDKAIDSNKKAVCIDADKAIDSNKKAVCIEGDRAMFSTKNAIDRFKRDLKINDQEKLKTGDYFREGWTYQLISSNENEIKVKLVNVQDVAQQSRVLDCDERRKMLKDKIKQMKEHKQSPANLKLAMKNKVPEEILDAYLNLKKYNINVPIPRPDEVLEKQSKYKNIIHTMIQSFGNVNESNNSPVITYFKLLAKHLGIPTTFMSTQQSRQQQQQVHQQQAHQQQAYQQQQAHQQQAHQQQQQLENVLPTNNFIEELRKKRNDLIQEDVDDEMKKIYSSLGINVDENNADSDDQEIDDEIKKIYESLENK